MKEKLKSRKFWCAIGGYVSTLLTAFYVSDSTITQITTIISGVGLLVVYVFVQGKIDCVKAEKEDYRNEKM